MMKIIERYIKNIHSVKELRPREDIPINFLMYELVVDTDKEQGITITVDETDYQSIKEKGFYCVKLSDWES